MILSLIIIEGIAAKVRGFADGELTNCPPGTEAKFITDPS
jgi:hypothetical protein